MDQEKNPDGDSSYLLSCRSIDKSAKIWVNNYRKAVVEHQEMAISMQMKKVDIGPYKTMNDYYQA